MPAYVFLHVAHVARRSHVPIAGSFSPLRIGTPAAYVPGRVTSHTDIALISSGESTPKRTVLTRRTSAEEYENWGSMVPAPRLASSLCAH